MFVLNISFQIAPNLALQWLEWMKNKFIPIIESTGCFKDHKFYELMVEADQAPTYTLQLFATSPELMDQFQETLSEPILDELSNTWGDQCFHFITTMKIVN
jgi:heat shock protein HspQ